MSMYADIKLNNTTIFEDIQGTLVNEIAEYVEIVRGTELGFETVELNAKGFAKFLASRHTAKVINDTPVFDENDDLCYEEHRLFGTNSRFSGTELVSGLKNGTILFGQKITPETVMTVEIN